MIVTDTLGAPGRLATFWAALRGPSGRPPPPRRSRRSRAALEQLPRVDAVQEPKSENLEIFGKIMIFSKVFRKFIFSKFDCGMFLIVWGAFAGLESTRGNLRGLLRIAGKYSEGSEENQQQGLTDSQN